MMTVRPTGLVLVCGLHEFQLRGVHHLHPPPPRSCPGDGFRNGNPWSMIVVVVVVVAATSIE
jgi:hypothetical protein